jgi:hypothetical protein
MDVVISTLASALVADYLPFLSVGVKVALGSLLSRIIEFIVASKCDLFSWFHLPFVKRPQVMHIQDTFTAEALERFLVEQVDAKNCAVDTMFEYDSFLDNRTFHPGFRASFKFKESKITVEKAAPPTDHSKNESPERAKTSPHLCTSFELGRE